ncbi:MAG: DUF2079 domain-containing protein [Ruminococcaceae bacterium]|nr:DUF2079 domain-containing protein [Oscillospiraceae bacterium]
MNKKIKKIAENKQVYKYTVETFITTFLCAYFMVSIFNLLAHIEDEIFYTSLEFLQADGSGSFWGLLVAIAFIMLLLTALIYLFPKFNLIANTLTISAVLLAFILMYKSDTSQYYMYFAVMLVIAIVLIYATEKKCFSFIKDDFSTGIMWGAVAAFGLIFAFITGAIGVYRYLTYSTPNFDFGLFCNMFYNMAETGLPNVTSERDMFLSHFAVHFSPIYYVMLPFYYLFPSPITLQILQAIVIYSGIIPIVLIARKRGISTRITSIIALLYAAYPAISAGTFYDLHENCFLVPLLLWVFYFYEQKKYIPLAIFSVLTLLVKEDAFIYLVIFALYLLISEKNLKIGLPIAIVPVIYFVVVSTLMQEYGTGIMSGRFGNMIYDSEDGLLGVIKTILLNPGYTLSQIFATSANNTNKLKYLIQLLLPLGFMVFATKKISRFLLLAPILLNILTMYKYQPDITFQYSFGISAFLFYLVIMNVADMQPSFSREYLTKFAVVAAVLMFTVVAVPKYSSYIEKYEKNKEIYSRLDYVLEEVLPEDASVTCSTFLLAHIADRDTIYELNYHKENKEYKTDTEYIVLDIRSGYAKASLEAAEFFCSKGYTEFYKEEGAVLILVDENFNAN